MDALEKNKGMILGGILLLAALFVYNTFFTDFTSATEVAPAASAGADLVKVSENISKATLSRDLFSTTGYRLLFDFSTPLQSEPTGRVNPFAPIGQE